uniref:Uncharacterized protein n=1 Tax=Vitis vinifera TaxID=29760 RepID=F6GWC2_VITVI
MCRPPFGARFFEQQKKIRGGWFSWLIGFVDFGYDGDCLKPRQGRISKSLEKRFHVQRLTMVAETGINAIHEGYTINGAKQSVL